MLWLQVFNNDQSARQWPLSSAIARAWGDALILGAGHSTLETSVSSAVRPEIRRHLADRLADDPLLALWCCEHASRSSPACQIPTADEVVDWLATDALNIFRSDPAILSHVPTWDAAGQRNVDRAADLVERAATLAHLSAALARAHDDRAATGGLASRLPDEAAHAARLAVAARWFADSDEPSDSSVRSVESQLPPASELETRAWQSTTSATAPQPAMHCVDAARRRLAAYREGASSANAAVVSAIAHGALVRQRWSAAGDSAAGPALLAIVASLSRLADMETRFASTLAGEKLDALAEFAGGAGHEINNPLAVIAGRTQLLLPGERDPQRRRELAIIGAQAMRIHEMIADLMLFARPPQMKIAPCDLGELVEQSLTPFRELSRQREIQLVYHRPAEPVVVPADAVQLLVALGALIRNSVEAFVGTGRIEVSLEWMEGPNANRRAEIVVSDDGPGLGDDVRRHLFDPYYSGRPAGRGLGLGLSKCWRIVTAHGGDIDLVSEPGRGATFRLRLPE